ncbi:MAG: hypothetical protein R3F34_13975 [Planctomycetota bacterium]
MGVRTAALVLVPTLALAAFVDADRDATGRDDGQERERATDATPALRFPELPRGDGLAAGFPADRAIATHDDVLFAEDFECELDELRSRWTDASDASRGVMQLVDGGPVDLPGGRALRITASPPRTTGGSLYRSFERGERRLHARFYVRFPADAAGYVHHFVHLGGYEPATPWPQGNAGVRPNGDDRVTVGIEPYADRGRAPVPGNWGFYLYWPEMKVSADGKFWGGGIAPSEPLVAPLDRWQCVEVMLDLGTPNEHDGELALWIDGEPRMHVLRGTPRGPWTGLGFELPSEGGEPFEGFLFRTSESLELNFFWLLHYVTPEALRRAGVTDVERDVAVEFDHVVVARAYVGPIRVDAHRER